MRPTTKNYTWTAFAFYVLAIPLAAQELAPLGDQFQVNTRTTGDQVAADVVARPGGGFLAVWEGDLATGIDPSTGGRRFDGSGNPEGDEFRINSNGTLEQRDPAVAVDQAGRIGVVFRVGLLDFATKISARVSNTMGIFVESDFAVNDIGNNASLEQPAISASSQSELVAVWLGVNLTTFELSIEGRRMLTTGTPAPVLDEIQVRSVDGGANQFVWSPSVAVDASGNFVVVWFESDPFLGDPEKLLGRTYDAMNNPVAGPFQIDTDTTASLSVNGLSVDCDAIGNFVVTWSAASMPPSPSSRTEGFDNSFNIRARRFDASANPLGDEFIVNDFTDNTQESPDIAMRGDGQFVVTWTSTGSSGNDASGQSIQARHFAADGTPMGPDIQVNSFTTGNQFRPAIAALEDDRYAVVWQGVSADDDVGISGRRLGLVVIDDIFADNFESSVSAN